MFFVTYLRYSTERYDCDQTDQRIKDLPRCHLHVLQEKYGNELSYVLAEKIFVSWERQHFQLLAQLYKESGETYLYNKFISVER